MSERALALIRQLKHMAGKHPQKSHGREGAGGSLAAVGSPVKYGVNKGVVAKVRSNKAGDEVVDIDLYPKGSMNGIKASELSAWSDPPNDLKTQATGGDAIDPYWKKVAGGSSTVVYHGTDVNSAKRIMREGLKPGTGPNKYSDTLIEADAKRKPSVFLTSDNDQANAYGEGGAVLKIRIPKSAYPEVKLDEIDFEEFAQTENFRMERTIPASWIEGYELVED